MSQIYKEKIQPTVIKLREAERNSLEHLATKHFNTTMAGSVRYILSWAYINDANVSMQEINKIRQFKY